MREIIMEHKNLLKKMITQLVLSVSIFSMVMFSYTFPYCSSPLIIYSEKLMNYYFSSDLFILLSRVMNSKNSIFLICNGLLFILAKTSGCARSSPSPSGFDLSDVLQKEIIESEVPIVEKHVILEELSVEEEEDNEEEFDCSSEETKEVSIFINTESDEEEEEEEVVENDESESKSWLFDDDEKEEEDEDETEMLSTEELNQKFENFIRRMKEEFRINEARQQLVVVK